VVEAVERSAGLLKKIGHSVAESGGLTKETNYRGGKWLGALLAMLYNDIATWWDTRFAPSLVGGALNVRGTLPRLRAKRDSNGNVIGTELATTMDAYETQQLLQAYVAGSSAVTQNLGIITANPVLWGVGEVEKVLTTGSW
jgi:hypothetical protein